MTVSTDPQSFMQPLCPLGLIVKLFGGRFKLFPAMLMSNKFRPYAYEFSQMALFEVDYFLSYIWSPNSRRLWKDLSGWTRQQEKRSGTSLPSCTMKEVESQFSPIIPAMIFFWMETKSLDSSEQPNLMFWTDTGEGSSGGNKVEVSKESTSLVS